LSSAHEKNAKRVFTTAQTQKPRKQQKTMKNDDTIEGEFWED
jgi:hypothetical protein